MTTVHVVPTHSTPEMTYLSITHLKIQSFKKLQNWKLERANITPCGKLHIRPTDKSQSNASTWRQICFHMIYMRFIQNIPYEIIPIFEKGILTYVSQLFQVRNNQLVCNRLFCKVWRKSRFEGYSVWVKTLIMK